MATASKPKSRLKQFIDRVFRRNAVAQAQPVTPISEMEPPIQPETSSTQPIEAPIRPTINKDEFWKARAERADMLRELNKSSPYAKDIAAFIEAGDYKTAEFFQCQQEEWAKEVLSYRSQKEETGLLGEAAKSCMKNDLGVQKEIVEILDGLRGREAQTVFDFNKAVDSGVSSEIRDCAEVMLDRALYLESEKFQAINAESVDIFYRLSRVEFQTPREKLIDELSQRSPYLESIEENKTAGYWNEVDRLEFESEQWAKDLAGYLLKPPVDGLLSESARQCLREDYGLPDEAIDLLGTSREGYTARAEYLNSAVENASSSGIGIAVKELCAQIEIYETDKLEALIESRGLDWPKIHNAIHFDVTPKTAAERSTPVRSSPIISESHTDSQSAIKLRNAPMIVPSGNETAQDFLNQPGEAKERQSDKGVSR